MYAKITSKLINSKVINTDDKDIYEYGIQILLLKLVHISIFLVIGIAYNVFIEFIFFLIIFKNLRENTGGYHSNTIYKCFIISFGISLILLFSIRLNFSLNNIFSYTIPVALVTIITYLSPIDSPQKLIANYEKRKYKIKVFYISVVYTVLYYYFIYIKMYIVAFVILYCLIICVILLIISILKRRIYYNY